MKQFFLAVFCATATATAATAEFLQPVEQEMQQELEEYLMDEVLEHPDKIEDKLSDSVDEAIRAAQRYEEAYDALWSVLAPEQKEQELAIIRKTIALDCRIALHQSLWAGSPEKSEADHSPGTNYPALVQALVETQAAQTQRDINANMGSAAKVMEAYMEASRRALALALACSANPVTGKAWASDEQRSEAERLYKELLKAGVSYREALLELSIPDDDEFWSTGLPMFRSALTCRLLDSEEMMLLPLLPPARE